MAKKRKKSTLRDLKPSKDEKGGQAAHALATCAGILRKGARPKPDKAVIYMTRSGRLLDGDAVKRRSEVSIPIAVHYKGEGKNRVIGRVILDED